MLQKIVKKFFIFILILFSTITIDAKELVESNANGVTFSSYSARNGARNGTNIKIFLNKGEHIKIDATLAGMSIANSATSQIGQYTLIGPDGTVRRTAFPVGTSNNWTITLSPTQGTKTMNLTATETGVYVLESFINSMSGTGDFHDLTFKITNTASPNHITGRVWINKFELTQQSRKLATGNFASTDSATFYPVTHEGYQYEQRAEDFNAIEGSFYSAPIGIVKANDTTCSPQNFSTYARDPKYQNAGNDTNCLNKIKLNNIFLEKADVSLPKQASYLKTDKLGKKILDANGNDIFIDSFLLPIISDYKPAASNLSVKNDATETTFSFKTKDYFDYAFVLIDIDYDRDGQTDDTIKLKTYINNDGTHKINWNKKDSKGKQVNKTSLLKARLDLPYRGSIHLVNYDVETRKTMRIKALNGQESSYINDDTVFYNHSKLPIDYASSPNCIAPLPLKGSYSSMDNSFLNGWLLRIGSNPTHCKRTPPFSADSGYDSFGDENNILEWKQENIKLVYNFNIINTPLLTSLKKVEDDNKNNIAEKNEILKYSIDVYNKGYLTERNIKIMDAFEDDKFNGSRMLELQVEKLDKDGTILSSKKVKDFKYLKSKPILSLNEQSLLFNESLRIKFSLKMSNHVNQDNYLTNQAKIRANNGVEYYSTSKTSPNHIDRPLWLANDSFAKTEPTSIKTAKKDKNIIAGDIPMTGNKLPIVLILSTLIIITGVFLKGKFRLK